MTRVAEFLTAALARKRDSDAYRDAGRANAHFCFWRRIRIGRAKSCARSRLGRPPQVAISNGTWLAFDRVGGGVPSRGRVAEVGFVRHVARERGVMTEDRVFGDGAVAADGLEEIPKMRFQFIP